MENSPELQLKGKYLGQISAAFARLSPLLKEAAYEIKARKISEFPIFALCKNTINLGSLLLDTQQSQSEWNVYFTYMEELLDRKIIAPYREEAFVRSYKDPSEYACLLVVEPEFTNFIYLPFPEENDDIQS
jgi:hypothetical protein